MDGLSINSRLTDFFDNEGGFDVRMKLYFLDNLIKNCCAY